MTITLADMASSRAGAPAAPAIDAAWAARLEAACRQACGSIAPAWPLDRAIAVNPHWQRIGRPLREVAARMALLGEIQVFPPRQRQREAWVAGRIAPADLSEALAAHPEAQALGLTPERCVEALAAAPALSPLPLLIDVLDDDPRRSTRLSWREAITHQVGQACAAYFDHHQADWQPRREGGLYGFWRESIQHDPTIGMLMGLPGLRRGLQALPATREAAEQWVMHRLDLPESAWADYLEAVLLTVQGWASWCAWLGWQAGQQGQTDPHLRELLAIRLAWGALLLECKGEPAARTAFQALKAAWRDAPRRLDDASHALVVDEVWQHALELGLQRQLAAGLLARAGTASAASARPRAQAVFCIDVRSEPLRRAVESVDPEVQTMGFAGFFGLPVAYTPLASEARRPQLPGLLAPAMEVVDGVIDAQGRHDPQRTADLAGLREERFGRAQHWDRVTRWPGAAFSFVESLGLGYLGTLARGLLPQRGDRPRDDLADLPARYRPVCRPRLAGLDAAAQVDLAARVLGALGLKPAAGLHAVPAAPLVLLVGHGSHTTNNAHAAALDCGACCGQTGEVNARTLAHLLNDAEVRRGLESRGLVVPADTVFVAALHNTTTDAIEPFDLDRLTPAQRRRWDVLAEVLAQAGDRVRRERAPRLGLDPARPAAALHQDLVQRANDPAQTRPEWGLAGNAFFVIAPRARTRGLDLGGRSFLHDYEASLDEDGSLLELLMTAPMLVTHWINWQYHASTCDPQRLGSGNKVLHNVVGGHIGVFEGNGGDLRVGLSLQSLHDGQRWMHEPVRLSVVIEAPAEAIERVIDKHPVLQQLLGHGWLHLGCLQGETLRRYAASGWTDWPRGH